MIFSEINFIKLLKSFSKNEIREFEKFISSPFFNSQTVLINLYNELVRFHPEFKENDLSKEKIFESIFRDKVFNDTLFRKYISNLMKLAENYLIYKNISENEDRRITCLLDQFDKKHLTGFFEKQMTKTEKNISENSKIKADTFYYKHCREELKASYFIRINEIQNIKHCLIKSHIYILFHMLLTTTDYTNHMLIVQNSFRDSEGDSGYFDKVNKLFDLISYLENNSELTDTEKMLVSLCKIDITIFKNPYEISNLKIMKNIIFNMADELSKSLLYTFFSHLNFYYLLNISRNIHELNEDLFLNYKYMSETGLFVSEEKGFINFSEYRTILLYSLRLKELEFAEKFILENENYHDPVLKKNILYYSMALLNFEKKEYEKSLKMIAAVKVNDFIIKMDLDTLRLLIYYDLNYTDSALSLIDSFRHFLSGNKILSKDVIKSNLGFLKYYRILLMGKNNNSAQVDFTKIKSEILNNNNLRRKTWLIEKIDNEFMNSGSA